MVLAVAPVNVPLTPEAGGVLAGAGVDDGVDLGVALGVDLGVALGVDLGVDLGDALGVALGVAVLPVTGVLVLVVIGAGAGIGGVVVLVPRANPVVVPNCGGVIDNTAPRPVIVPPAIKKKRLVITGVPANQPSGIQILHCGNDRAGYQLHAPPCAQSRLDQSGHRCKHRSHRRLELTW